MQAVNNRILITEFVACGMLMVSVVGVGVRVGTVSNDSTTQLFVAVISIMLIGSVIWRITNAIAPTQMNPLITLGLMARRKIEIALGTEHIAAQVSGGIVGVVTGNMLFGLQAFSPDDQSSLNPNRFVGEFLVSLGVVALTLFLYENERLYLLGAAVPLWLVFGSALTSSPSFGNPAITVANSISHTITSEPSTALPGMLSSQLLGGIAAYAIVWFFRFRHEIAE